MKDHRNVDGLISALLDQDASTRIAAAEALGQLGVEAAAGPLMEALARCAPQAPDEEYALRKALHRAGIDSFSALFLLVLYEWGAWRDGPPVGPGTPTADFEPDLRRHYALVRRIPREQVRILGTEGVVELPQRSDEVSQAAVQRFTQAAVQRLKETYGEHVGADDAIEYHPRDVDHRPVGVVAIHLKDRFDQHRDRDQSSADR